MQVVGYKWVLSGGVADRLHDCAPHWRSSAMGIFLSIEEALGYQLPVQGHAFQD
jgi:hypothetical protein